MRRELESRVANRRADPIAAFPYGRIGQPDHREMRQTERDVYLDLDRVGVNAEHSSAAKRGQHGAGCCKLDDEYTSGEIVREWSGS
jgi:hypothetical protein